MSGSGEEDVFVDCGASPDLRSPNRRRSTRSSTRKRSSTGSVPAPYSRPKTKKKMSTLHSPPSGKAPAANPVPAPQPDNPFVGLTGAPQNTQAQPDLMAQMQQLMGGMLGGMETRLGKANADLQESLTGQIGKAMESIGSLDTRISASEKRIDQVICTLEDTVEKKIEEGLKKLSSRQDMDLSFPCLPGTQGLTQNGEASSMEYSSYATAAASMPSLPVITAADRKLRDYWACRKALRIRPVGDGPEFDEALTFMRDHLKLEDSFLRCVKDVVASRIPFGPKSKYKKEMLLTFRTVEARDIVRSAASNLAGKGQEYGIRLEIANHMKADMKALQAVSYDIKQRHPEARRNVLFDDDSLELALDFSIGDGHPWKRVAAGQARARRRPAGAGGSGSGFRMADRELGDLLGPGNSASKE